MENLSQSLFIVANHMDSLFYNMFFAKLKPHRWFPLSNCSQTKISLDFKRYTFKNLVLIFQNILCLFTFFSGKLIKEAIYWQTLYMTFFFVTGANSTDEKKNDIEYWKTLVYTFGRVSQASLDLTKIPAINEHTIVIHLLYDELWDNDLL